MKTIKEAAETIALALEADSDIPAKKTVDSIRDFLT